MPILGSLLRSYLQPATDGGNKTARATTASSPVPAAQPVSPAPASVPSAPAYQQNPLPSPTAQQPEEPNDFFSRRSCRQFGLFFSGAVFLYSSVMITRRAIRRHRVASRMQFYQPNQFNGRTHHDAPQRSPLLAFEALNLATLNTMAFAVMMVGGVCWAFDISTLEDLRRKTRASIEATPGGTLDEMAEKEVVEWVAKTLKIDLQSEKEKPPPDSEGKR
ncbi:uncharacterized protein B0T15DRAFT_47930 [Chaetomium strumarium]|uniref:Altered inheritance of mitochondria protein 11 n=1 Tax=Chaetomium strumarium TaxID=1170767 RepID=A0AAJ0M6K2_9PEZI|nr:hypothetical protein B0T15DRAFT_47930 [Chaetomium strumarium]